MNPSNIDTHKIGIFVLNLTVISLFTFALLSLSIWYRVFTPNLYINSLNSSGIYEQSAKTITQFSANYISENINSLVNKTFESKAEQYPILSNVGSSILSQVSSTVSVKITQQIANNINLQQKLQDKTENSVISYLKWLRGKSEDPQFFNYIPTEQQVQTLDENGVINLMVFIGLFKIYGFNELPICQNQTQTLEALNTIQTGELKSINCVDNTVLPVLFDTFKQSSIGGITQEITVFVNEWLKTNNLDTVVGDVHKVLLITARSKQDLLEFKHNIIKFRNINILILTMSIPLLFVASYIQKSNKLIHFLKLILISGTILVLTSVLYKLVVPGTVANSIQPYLDLYHPQYISAAQTSALIISIKNLINSITYGVMDYTITVGIILVALSGLPYIALEVHTKRLTKQSQQT